MAKIATTEDLMALKMLLEQGTPPPVAENLELAIAPAVPTVLSEVSMSEEVDLDHLDVEAALASIMRTRISMEEAGSPGDEELQAAIARKENARVQLPQLYKSRVELKRLLDQKRPKLAIAQQHRMNDMVVGLLSDVAELELALGNSDRLIKAIETRYEDVVADIKSNQSRTLFAQTVLSRFIQNEAGEYTAPGVVNPMPATIEKANVFLAGVIKQITTGEQALVEVCSGAVTRTSWISKYPGIQEINELGVAVNRYRQAIAKAERQKLEEWAESLVSAGFLISPNVVKTMKEKGQAGLRRNLLDMVENAEAGYLFMPVSTHDPCTVPSYLEVRRPEILARVFVTSKGVHMLRFDRATAPQLVDRIFVQEGSRRQKVTVPFNDASELLNSKGSAWKQIPKMLQDSLLKAHTFALRQRQEQADLAKIRDVSWLEDLCTLQEIGQGKAGTAVVLVSQYAEEGENYRTYSLAMRIVSDGNLARPGMATSRSKEGWLYNALRNGVKVSEFFARAKDGMFGNAKLQDVAVRNEGFEVDATVTAAVTTHGAERISVKNGNVDALCMAQADGGRDGTFVFTVLIHDRKPGSPANNGRRERDNVREVAYVATRTEDAVTFMAGLTVYSRTKFEGSGCKFNEPYSLESLTDYPRYLLRTVYCAVTSTAREKVPSYLLRDKPVVKASGGAETPETPADEEPANEPISAESHDNA